MPEDTRRPSVRGAEAGLEVHWWVVRDPDGSLLGEALGGYAARPVPMSERTRAAWRANGLRIVSIPLEDLGDLRASIWEASTARARHMAQSLGVEEDQAGGVRVREPIVGGVHRQWLGQCPDWTNAVDGPWITESVAVGLDNGPLVLGPGRLRLLVRCWVTPLVGLEAGSGGSPAGAAGLALELAPQHQERAGPGESIWIASGVRSAPSPLDEGLVFGRLAAELVCRGDGALVIVGEDPRAAWGSDADPVAEDGLLAGPAAPRAMSLGERMLSRPSAGGLERAVVVLIPRVPERFDLARP